MFGIGTRAKLGVDIDADARGVGPGVAQAQTGFGKLASGAKKAGLLVAAGLAIGAVAIVGIGTKLFEMGDRAADSNARIVQVTKSMDLFGKATDRVSGRIIRYAEATARQTGVDQNVIKATQAKLLTFRELAASADDLGGNFDRATRAAVDMAATGFGSAESNAVQLGKALNDPIKGITALARAGVTFTEAEKARIAAMVEGGRIAQAQSYVLTAIEKQVGGTAAAMVDPWDKLKIVLSQNAEAAGMRLLPAVAAVSNWILKDGLPAVDAISESLADRFGPSIAQAGEWITGRLLPGVRRAADQFEERWGPSIERGATFLTDKLLPAAAQFAGWLAETFGPALKEFAEKRLEGAQSAFRSVRDAIQENRPQLEQLGRGLQKVAEFVADKIIPILSEVSKQQLVQFGNAIGVVIDAVGFLVDAFNKAVDGAQKLKDAITSIPKPDLPDLTPGFDVPFVGRTIAGFEGAPSTYAATPSSGAYIDARVFVSIDGSGVVDEAAIARQLDPVLNRHATRLGNLSPVLQGAF